MNIYQKCTVKSIKNYSSFYILSIDYYINFKPFKHV
jgi:hypothetical protein